MGDELIDNHQIVVNAVAKRLKYSNESTRIQDVFTLVANEIYKDGNENWGRIVSLYVLGAILALNDNDETHGYNMNSIVDFVGEYIDNKSKWIEKNGGWVS